MNIINLVEPFEIDVKRFYFPATVEGIVCKECGEVFEEDFSCNYLAYPTTNRTFEHTVVCSKEHETKIKLLLKVTLEGPKKCNIHDDCDAADAEAVAAKKGIEHCWEESCMHCFGGG